MSLTDKRLNQADNPNLTPDRRAVLLCRIAAEYIHQGQYENAREALGDLWRGIGEQPELRKLNTLTRAEVLLQCGVLSGWLGSAQQITGAQEKAKDLLSEALRKFQSQGKKSKVSEAQYEIGMCYWRAGAYDESRVILNEALQNLEDKDAELKAKILIRRTLVEVWTGRYHDAWSILKEAQDFFESCHDAIKGRWHGQMGLVFKRLASAEGRTDYYDNAIIEYTAAIYHYEQAHHKRYCGTNLNNLAFVLLKLGRYKEAHEHLDRAQKIFAKDPGNLAQVNETRARVLIAEQRYTEADKLIEGVVRTLETGGEQALLADALTVQGIVRSQLGEHDDSIAILRRAVTTAEEAGALCNAGLAALTLVEEHRERLSASELHNAYRRADELLKNTQDAESISRLRTVARAIMEKLSGASLSDKDFSLPAAVHAYEARFIEQALEMEDGAISRAAQRLGLKHQTLSHLLANRHKQLQPKRKPLVNRKRSIFRIRHTPSIAFHRTKKKLQPISILVVEDDTLLASALKDTLELEGWDVEVCKDGTTGLRRIMSVIHYDLLIFDNDLPGIAGLELIERARRFSHRRETPIIMLSAANNIQREALEAGANLFLRKPEDILKVVDVAKQFVQPQRRIVLVIEDKDTPATMKQLEAKGFQLIVAESTQSYIEAAQDESPDLILINQPQSPLDALAVGLRLREQANLTEEIPVIFIHREPVTTNLGHNIYATDLKDLQQMEALLTHLLPAI
ncbi:MAG: response regulator [Pyrinomonadaceae bacterium]